MLKLLDRMMLTELRGPFLFGVALFSMLTIATVALQEAARFVIKHNLSTMFFFKLLGLSAPQFIVLAIPMGVLMGTLLSVGRLNGDQEINALRACGFSLFRLIAPYLGVGLLLTGLTFLGNERLVPYCMSALRDMKNEVTTGRGGAKQERFSWPIYDHGELRWALFAGQMEGTDLSDVLLFYFHPKDKYQNFMVEAESASWKDNTWMLYHGRFVKLQYNPAGDEQVVSPFDRTTVPDFSILPESLALRKKNPEDLTSIQLSKHIHNLLSEENYSQQDKEILGLKTSLGFKYALPFTPFLFILVAFPLAIMPQRSSRAMGMGLALLIVLIYYAMYTASQKLGAVGALPPFVAAWVPNGLLIVSGIALLRQRNRG